MGDKSDRSADLTDFGDKVSHADTPVRLIKVTGDS